MSIFTMVEISFHPQINANGGLETDTCERGHVPEDGARQLAGRGPDDWRATLADPEKHWKDGRSAKMLAEAWEAGVPDMPAEIRAALRATRFESFRPHVAIPEYQVELPGGGRASQNDLYVLGRIGAELAVLMIEGKVDESFGRLLEEWLRVRYQLLHRTASPLLEATRIGARRGDDRALLQ